MGHTAKNSHVLDMPIDRLTTAVWLTQDEVLQRIPVARTTIFYWINEGHFPRPFKYKNKVFWDEAEIDDWIKTRPTSAPFLASA